jgi:hypothetical protein
MRINRSLFNWGVFLIALGGVPLAVDQGWIDSDIASDLGRLWPLILVGIGLGLVLRWTPLSWFGGALVAATFGVIFGAAAVSLRDNDLTDIQGLIPAIASGACVDGSQGDETTTREGIASDEAFTLTLSIPCGELSIERATTPTWRVDATHAAGEAPRVDETTGTAGATGVSIRDDGAEEIAFIGRQSRSDWAVEVPAEAALTLDATFDAARGTVDTGPGPVTRLSSTLNAADVEFDLGEADPTQEVDIGLTLNASDGRLVLPAGPSSTGVTLNASSLDVCVPEAVPVRIELTEILASSDLVGAGLERLADDRWATPGYDDGSEGASIELTSTVSSFSIERPEACS